MMDFEGPASFLFVNPTGTDSLSFATSMPAPSSIKKKCIVVVKARDSTDEPGFTCIANEIIFMELNRPILDNLYQLCNVSAVSQPQAMSFSLFESNISFAAQITALIELKLNQIKEHAANFTLF